MVYVMADEKDEIMDATIEIVEKPKQTVVSDLKSYLSSFVVETNIEKYEYLTEDVSGTTFVTGIKLFVKVLGIIKPVDVDFSELGFAETRLKIEDVDKIFSEVGN